MKIQSTKCFGKTQVYTIAEGIPGGCYVKVQGDAGQVGLTETFEQDLTGVTASTLGTFFLAEGEKLYSKGTSDYTPSTYTLKQVIYFNPEPSAQNNNPLNLTGTIQLSQS